MSFETRLASERQSKPAEGERISAEEIQSYDQVLHVQSVNVRAFLYRTGRPTFEATCLGSRWLAVQQIRGICFCKMK